jgi:recombination protein RecA
VPTAAKPRLEIESALALKIPSALTPQATLVHPVIETGIGPLDDLFRGGLPVGAMSELTGPECSGRTSVALSFLARLTEANKVCA